MFQHHKKTLPPVNPMFLEQKGLMLDMVDKDNDVDAFRRQFCSILNKITWKTYSELYDDIIRLGINKNEHYQQIASGMILYKASMEPQYCQIYAQLCAQICFQNTKTKFRKFLTTRIWEEFNTGSFLDRRIAKLSNCLEIGVDEKRRAQLKEKVEFLKRKVDDYASGTIK
jgi:hypothetical protein